jgi:hypothetical protein
MKEMEIPYSFKTSIVTFDTILVIFISLRNKARHDGSANLKSANDQRPSGINRSTLASIVYLHNGHNYE